MREIKFRGKAKVKKPVQMFGYVINPDEWITTDTILRAPRDGDSIALPQVQAIHEFWHLVDDGWIDPATVGQWTGLKDKNGVEIYDGDVIDNLDVPCKHTIDTAPYGSGLSGWYAKQGNYSKELDAFIEDNDFNIVVIGNIHEVNNGQVE